MPLVSIVIPVGPTHAACAPHAIQSCLAQTHSPVEVVVVDDTESGDLAIEAHPSVVVVRSVRGVCAARNLGLQTARGEFLMFLDADDTIEPTKVARQLRELEMAPEADWVLCDVQIRDEASRTVTLASDRYKYADKTLSGWIYPLLRDGNFIPIMSPLVRTSLLRDHAITFDDRLQPEDYHFWCKVAKAGRVRYVPEILATYNKSKTGRSRTPPVWRQFNPRWTAPLRLNLGCGTQGTRSWHPMPGLINLDKSMGWRFEDGLVYFADDSVAGITVSHALMYVPLEHWKFVFSEFYRVLRPGGVIRITEDETFKPASSRVGGWKGSDPAVTLTGDERLWLTLTLSGFTAVIVGPKETLYEDASLVQQQHGDPPDVFFIEGVKRA